ncbi:hypothetical protein [Methyloversatilis sp. NSM2]|uniref:hypothetical protein n=1 Tax=Methyloversatilis sp. NSM2 TaxID=3134135 RepID=UPI003117A86D
MMSQIRLPIFLLILLLASSVSYACDGFELSKGPFQVIDRFSNEFNIGSCELKGSRAIALTGTISRLASKTSYSLSVKFLSGTGARIGIDSGATYVGNADEVELDEYFLVPAGASKAVFFIKVESRRPSDQVAELINGRVHRAFPVSIHAKNGYVSRFGDSVEWVVASHDRVLDVSAIISVRDIGGGVVSSRELRIPAGAERGIIRFDDIPLGYYSIEAKFLSDGHRGVNLSSSFAVFKSNANDIPDKRFGLDAALSWYGGSDDEVRMALDLMKKAGIGSVRDRLSWAQVNRRQGQFEWGRYLDVARMTSLAGFDVATVFHDSPAWTRPNDQDLLRNDKKPPVLNEAAREFGLRFAQDVGQYINYVEYWNEQNSDFFRGLPFQYAAGLKEFAAGVKEKRSAVSILLGAPTGSPGVFFDELYSNNVIRFVDGVSIHYYKAPGEFISFYSNEFLRNYRLHSRDIPATWVTETGAPVVLDESGSFLKSELDQSTYLAKTFVELLASGQERVFYFFLRDLVEPEFGIWGVLRRDFSPRPSYVTLGSLIRHLEGAKFVASVRNQKYSIFFFKRPDEFRYRAVAWGEGNPDKLLGKYQTVQDHFGRSVGGRMLSREPLFFSEVESLPNAAAVAVGESVVYSRDIPKVRLSSNLRVDGVEFGGVNENGTSIAVSDGGAISLFGVVDGVATTDQLRVRCAASTGVDLLGPSFSELKEDSNKRKRFECAYRAGASLANQSFVKVELFLKGQLVDYSKVVLKPDINLFAKRSHYSSDGLRKCLRWLVRSSPSVRVTLGGESRGVSGCVTPSVVSRQTVSGDAWVFPYAKIDLGPESFRGVAVEVRGVSGAPFPPKNFVLQLVERSGGIWLVDLEARDIGGVKSYVGLFGLAKRAPWKPSSSQSLQLSEVHELMFGWGGYAGKQGDVFGFSIGEVEFVR